MREGLNYGVLYYTLSHSFAGNNSRLDLNATHLGGGLFVPKLSDDEESATQIIK